ncbi:MAG: SMC-Scp complex subunit ScpB [Chitinivibrionales bacterium]
MANSKPDIESQRIAEALLFSSREPLSVNKLSDIIPGKPNKKQLKDMIEEINITLQKQRHPFEIVETAGGFQTRTVAYYQQWINKLFNEGKKRRMSIQALECLSIIAYKQPVSKANIEKIRGVASDGAMKTLLERNMVSIKGRSDKPGRPLLYGTTDKFLEYFGINRISDLPELSEFEEIAKEKIMESEDIKELEDIQEQTYTGQESEGDTGESVENQNEDHQDSPEKQNSENNKDLTQEEEEEEENSETDESTERPDKSDNTEGNNSKESEENLTKASQENPEKTEPEENENESGGKDTTKGDNSYKDKQGIEGEDSSIENRENLENTEKKDSETNKDLTQEEEEENSETDESTESPEGSKPERNEGDKQGDSDEAHT